MAKKPDAPGSAKAVLLLDCGAGKAGTVIELDAEDIDRLVAEGHADSNAAAIEYADRKG